MEICIIIPSYKPKEYIWECLASIKNQTFDKALFEIIIVLNGCNEPYYSEINNYINTCFVGYNVNIIQTDIGGVSNARNIGLDNAKGKYIAFIDDDDKIEKEYLSELFKNSKDESITVSSTKTFDSSGSMGIDYIAKAFSKNTNTSQTNIFHLRSFLSSSCCKLIPQSVISNIRFNDNFSIGEDSLFMFEVSNNFSNIILVNTHYLRRIRNGSASRVKIKIFDNTKNCYNLIKVYTKVYHKSTNIGFKFYISRVIASLMNLFR